MYKKLLLVLAAFAVVAVPATFAKSDDADLAADADTDTLRIIQRSDGTLVVPGNWSTIKTADGVTVLRSESAVIDNEAAKAYVKQTKKKRRGLIRLPFISLF